MTELPAEGDEVLLVCCARPFGAVMANSSAPAMKSLLRLRIFIKSSWLSGSRTGKKLPAQEPFTLSARPSLFARDVRAAEDKSKKSKTHRGGAETLTFASFWAEVLV
jgi:hypothetical protein